MERFVLNYKKTVHGFVEIEADNLSQAKKKFEGGEYDEFDNKSDYEFEKDEQDNLKFKREGELYARP